MDGTSQPTGAEITQAAETDDRRSINTTMVACKRIRMGVFFDGTGNNRFLVGTPGFDGWHTNIDFLEQAYKETTEVMNGCNVTHAHVYVMGIGTDKTGTYTRGMALGLGKTGVYQRTLEAIEEIEGVLKSTSDGELQAAIEFDVFGFSRGAAAARYFANLVNNGEAFGNQFGPTKVKFLGIFDTVGSTGIPGNEAEVIDISTSAATAEHIVHITADSEFRENFPLTLARVGQRIRMVGAHSDIGGGYGPTDTSGHVGINNPVVEALIKRDWLSDDEQLQQANFIMDEMITPGMYRWKAEPGLSFVALAVMHKLAVDSPTAVPFNSNPHVFPEDLQHLYDSMLSGERLGGRSNGDIRRKYAHFSIKDSPGMQAEGDAMRDEFTL
ncbi:T6SS phospholipase effector Tle1-like catalytic domain-containing protein [Halocynthiibacter sp.]|uniref:T6SS phospholipase effector Tle1-like catalytic domain-containing protein n=1 Tax=Halocynthiibacter sp. TaxID=1979210 RepID=UPI003C527690